MAESAIYRSEDGSAMLLHPHYKDQVPESWFDPNSWGVQAQPVVNGGRGGAWFVAEGEHRWVLRQYRRGGIPAKFSTHTYFFLGERHVRAFAEFRLLSTLSALALPVPKPIAAHYAKKCSNIGYTAAILMDRIEGATSLPDHSQALTPALWENVGQTIRRFHAAGVDHVDLNCYNILVAAQSVYLIDFDRCVIRPVAEGHTAWQRRNLKRLARSFQRIFRSQSAAIKQRLWQSLMRGYMGADE